MTRPIRPVRQSVIEIIIGFIMAKAMAATETVEVVTIIMALVAIGRGAGVMTARRSVKMETKTILIVTTTTTMVVITENAVFTTKLTSGPSAH